MFQGGANAQVGPEGSSPRSEGLSELGEFLDDVVRPNIINSLENDDSNDGNADDADDDSRGGGSGDGGDDGGDDDGDRKGSERVKTKSSLEGALNQLEGIEKAQRRAKKEKKGQKQNRIHSIKKSQQNFDKSWRNRSIEDLRDENH